MITAKLDTSRTQDALKRTAVAFKEESRQEMSDIARLVAVSLATSTQPYGVGADALKAGEAAVHRDIYKIYCTPAMVYGEIANTDIGIAKSFYKAFRAGNYGVAYGLLKSYAPKFSLVQIRQFDGGKLHQQRRNRRGRVSSSQKPIQLVTNPRALQQYVKAEQAKVGYAKAGWANCARLIRGGTGRASTRGLPGWVTRHRDAPASAVINTAGNQLLVTMNNNVRYAEMALPPAAKANAIASGLYRFKQGVKMAHKKAAQKARLTS